MFLYLHYCCNLLICLFSAASDNVCSLWQSHYKNLPKYLIARCKQRGKDPQAAWHLSVNGGIKQMSFSLGWNNLKLFYQSANSGSYAYITILLSYIHSSGKYRCWGSCISGPVLCWSHVSWAEIKDPTNVLSNFVHKCVYIPVCEHLSFAKIIHPPDRCGISKRWLNSMIITQVHLVLGTIIWQFVQTATKLQTTCNHDRPGPPHRASSPAGLSETIHRTAGETVGWHNQNISAQTVKNRLKGAHLHACHPHQGLTWLQFGVVTNFSGQMLTFDGHWHAGEVCSKRMNPGFNCTGQMADSGIGVVWASGLLMSTLWTECAVEAVGLWYGQA